MPKRIILQKIANFARIKRTFARVRKYTAKAAKLLTFEGLLRCLKNRKSGRRIQKISWPQQE